MLFRNLLRLNLLVCWLVAFSACSEAKESTDDKYQSIDWIQLMPEDDLNALLNPPEFIQSITDGSATDNVESLGEMSDADAQSQRYYEALNSARVMTEFDEKLIRLPGFIVPLASDDENKVTEFFIVPYFGACLHMPPPPPNQIVYATVEPGVALESIYDPFWFKGKLVIENRDHALGSAAYRLLLDDFYLYEE